jgi:hypothetical protein
MKYLSAALAAVTLIASAVCAARNPPAAAPAGAVGALLAFGVWRAFARRSREDDTILPASPEMSQIESSSQATGIQS